MKIKISILFLGLLLLNGVILRAQDYSFKPEYSTILDSSKGITVLHQCSRAAPGSVSFFWNPTKSDIKTIEENFKKVLSLKAFDCCLIGFKLNSLNRYIFQYTGVIIKKKKYIYINAFLGDLSDLKNWNTEPVIICDGGKSCWGVLFDIEKLEFSQLAFNGEG